MELPTALRDDLLETLDDYLENLGSNTVEPEQLVGYLLEQFEIFADEHGIEDIIPSLEESGALDTPLQETLEEEMGSNSEFEFTGEEVLKLVETVCALEWDDDLDFDDDDEEDEDDDEDEDF